MRGTLIWFNPDKRMGYIRTEEGERLLVEESGFEPGHVPEDRMAGRPLEFEREAADVEGGFRAVRVSTLSDEAPNRARRRHR